MLLPLKQKRLLAACFFAMLTLALCGPALIRHDLVMGQPGSNDIIAAFAPFHAFYHRTLAAGEWPLWNPHICGGMPTAMLGQNGLFYPLNWPTFALDAYDAMDVQIALHLFLSLLLTAWIARRLGLGGAGAIAVALTWTLSGSMAGRVFAGHLTIIQAMTWFPFAWGGLYRLLAAEEGEEGARENNRAADDRNAHCISGSGQSRSDRAKDWAAAVGGFTAMGLCGAPQIWMLALITAGATAAICLIFPKIATSGSRSERLARRRALAVRFAIWGAACLLLCAAEWIPTVAAGMQSERAQLPKEYNEQIINLPFSKLLTIPFPNLYGDNLKTTDWGESFFCETMPGVGMVGLLLALVFSWLAPERFRRLLRTIAALGVLALWLSFGSEMLLYGLLKALVPPMRMVAGAARALFVFTWALSLAAGLGIEGIQRLFEKNPRGVSRGAVAFASVGIALAAGAGALLLWGRGHWSDGATAASVLRSAIIAGVAFPALLMSPRFVKPVHACAWVFACVLFLDLLGAHQRFFACGPLFARGQSSKSMIQILTRDPDHGRVLRVIEEMPDEALLYGYEDVNGYGVTALADFVLASSWLSERPTNATHRVMINHPTIALREWFAMNYVLAYANQTLTESEWERVYADELYSLWKARVTYPRACVAERYHPVTHEEAGRLLRTAWPYEAEEIIVEGLAPDFRMPGGLGGQGRVSDASDGSDGSDRSDRAGEANVSARLVRQTANTRQYVASLARPGWLLMSENYAQGWRLKVNGKPARLYRAQYCLCAAPLPAGKHSVDLIYSPSAFWLGLALSALAVLGAMATAFVYGRFSKR